MSTNCYGEDKKALLQNLQSGGTTEDDVITCFLRITIS
jgi:hypothetical protein